jgi:hypothetical protein
LVYESAYGAGYFILVKLAENPTFIYLGKITGGLYHKTFYDRNNFFAAVSWSVCHCQALPPYYNICGQG